MKLWLWVALRTFKSGQKKAGASSYFALAGLSLGVASLVVAMAVMSGFETTLRDAVVDMTGHLLVVKRGKDIESPKKLEELISSKVSEVRNTIPFVMVEAVATKKGKIKGVMLHGIDQLGATLELGVMKRLVEGSFDIAGDGKVLNAVVGKTLARELDLKLGDSFKVVLPQSNDINPESLKRKLGEVKIIGIADLGKHQFDERYIITSLTSVQEFAELGDRYHGLIVKLTDPNLARAANLTLTAELGPAYWIKDWQDDNLFEAVKMEKVVIFFVLLLMILLAAFNISSSLFIGVVQRYSDISLLKAIGAKPNFIMKVFCLQGLLVGIVGVILGWLLGLLLIFGFDWMQNHFAVIDGSVYKLDRIIPQLRFSDNVAVLIAALLICLLATLAPARRGAKLKPIEGLRYE